MTIVSEDAPSLDDGAKVEKTMPVENMSDEAFAELAASIMVVIPHQSSEGINPGLARNFGQWGRICMPHSFVKDSSGGFIEVTRGNIVNTFLDYCEKFPHVRFLVMIDNDEEIHWSAPLRLAVHNLPVVSGVVCGYNDERGAFACIMAKDENGIARFPSIKETKMLPSTGVKKIAKCGTGLICIRRDVLETIRAHGEEPFFVPEDLRRKSVVAGAMVKGEDIAFCDRAVAHGFDIYVDFSVHAVHYKTLPLSWPSGCMSDKIDADSWMPSAFDFKGAG